MSLSHKGILKVSEMMSSFTWHFGADDDHAVVLCDGYVGFVPSGENKPVMYVHVDSLVKLINAINHYFPEEAKNGESAT